MTGSHTAWRAVWCVSALHMPTASIASRWSNPVSGCQKPAANMLPGSSWPRWPGCARAAPENSIRAAAPEPSIARLDIAFMRISQFMNDENPDPVLRQPGCGR